jgi:hypothetical protein
MEKKNNSGHSHNGNHKEKAKENESSGSGITPMDIDSLDNRSKPKKLTQEERARRIKENLCLYCGESGHRASGCPKKSKN